MPKGRRRLEYTLEKSVKLPPIWMGMDAGQPCHTCPGGVVEGLAAQRMQGRSAAHLPEQFVRPAVPAAF